MQSLFILVQSLHDIYFLSGLFALKTIIFLIDLWYLLFHHQILRFWRYRANEPIYYHLRIFVDLPFITFGLNNFFPGYLFLWMCFDSVYLNLWEFPSLFRCFQLWFATFAIFSEVFSHILKRYLLFLHSMKHSNVLIIGFIFHIFSSAISKFLRSHYLYF